MNKKRREMLLAIVLVCIAAASLAASIGLSSSKKDKIATVTYNEFMKFVRSGDVDVVYYSSDEEDMTFALFNSETRNMSDEERMDYKYQNEDLRKTRYPNYNDFRKEMLEAGVNLKRISANKVVYYMQFVTSLLSLLVMCSMVMMLASAMAVRKADIEKKKKSNIRFSDVIGHEEIIDDLKFIVQFIKNPGIGRDIGVQPTKGILLSGPPGTGKTLIAKAIAGEAGVPFLAASGSDFEEMFIGLGANRVRSLFKKARKFSPCVLFIDEIDCVGHKREGRRTVETNQTINALLNEMDGFTGSEGVIVIAATNYVESLDEALIRAGRFDKHIVVNPPRDWEVRADLFKLYMKNMKVAGDVNIESISKQVVGSTGADIAAIVNEAGVIALAKGYDCINLECFEEAIDKKVFKGNRSKKEELLRDKQIIAYHEAGHAVAHHLLGLPIARISIVGSTSGIGGAVFEQDNDAKLKTKEYYENRVMVCYAGRICEKLKFGVVTHGASNDIKQATNILYDCIFELGFDSKFSMVSLSALKAKNIVDDSYCIQLIQLKAEELRDKIEGMLKYNFILVDNLAKKLLECETLSGDEVTSFFEGLSK